MDKLGIAIATALAEIALVSILTLAGSVSGQAIEPDAQLGSGDLSTAEACVEYALANNPGLQASLQRWRAAALAVPQVKSLPDPMVSYRYNLRPVETMMGIERQSIEVAQTIPLFGRLDIAGLQAQQLAEAAGKDYLMARWMLIAEVKEAFYEFYYLARALEVTRASLQLLSQIEAVSRSRYQTGLGTQSDLLRIQVELGKLQDQVNTLSDQLASARARLNAALNRPIDAALAEPRPVQPLDVRLTDQVLLEFLDRHNPQIQAIDHMVRAAGHGVALARRQYAPDITVGLMITEVSADRMSLSSSNGQDMLAATVSLNIPIWGGRVSAAVRQAELERQAAILQRMDMANQLRARLSSALVQFRDATRRLDLYTNALLPKAWQALKVSQEAFRTGSITLLEVIDAQRSYLEFDLARERALADQYQAISRLEMLVGMDLARGRMDQEVTDGPR